VRDGGQKIAAHERHAARISRVPIARGGIAEKGRTGANRIEHVARDQKSLDHRGDGMRTRTNCGVMLVVGCLLCWADADAQERYRLRQLTDDPAQDGFPCWSPDGQRIVFSRYGAEAAPEKTGLWLVSPDGGEARQLTTVIGEHPNWSPDGHYIVFDGDFGGSIQLVSASGGTPIRVVPESIPIARGGQPKWSPDGTRIVFKEDASLWVLEVATGRVQQIFNQEGKRPLPACWSRDGGDIYVCLREAEGSNASIWAVSATGDGGRQLTPEKEGVYRYASVSPDGSLLAVVWCEGRNCDLWVMSSAGGKRVQITSHPSYDDGPSWSPDGKRIAFVSTRSDNFDIWTVEVDVEALRRELAD
jgi:Tol biopolymer transport system component